MSSPVLFVAAEAGAAAYLAPLWKRWCASGRTDWRVLGSPIARRAVTAEGLHGVPFTSYDPESPLALEAIVSEWRPRAIVMSATKSPVERLVITYAERVGCPVIQFVDTWHNYRDRFNGNGGPAWPERILVIDEKARDEAAAEGLPPDRLAVAGHPAWECVTALPAANPKHVLFVDQPIERGYGRSLGYTEADTWNIVLEVARKRSDLVEELVFCPHPERQSKFHTTCGTEHRIMQGAAALSEVGTVVGMFSSLMTDALLAGRSVISLQPESEGPDPCALSRHGLIPRVRSAAALVSTLEEPDIADTEDAWQ